MSSSSSLVDLNNQQNIPPSSTTTTPFKPISLPRRQTRSSLNNIQLSSLPPPPPPSTTTTTHKPLQTSTPIKSSFFLAPRSTPRAASHPLPLSHLPSPQPNPRSQSHPPKLFTRSSTSRKKSIPLPIPSIVETEPILPESDSEDPLLLKGPGGEKWDGSYYGGSFSRDVSVVLYQGGGKGRASSASPFVRRGGEKERRRSVREEEEDRTLSSSDGIFNFNDEDLIPLGSGTLEEEYQDEDSLKEMLAPSPGGELLPKEEGEENNDWLDVGDCGPPPPPSSGEGFGWGGGDGFDSDSGGEDGGRGEVEDHQQQEEEDVPGVHAQEADDSDSDGDDSLRKQSPTKDLPPSPIKYDADAEEEDNSDSDKEREDSEEEEEEEEGETSRSRDYTIPIAPLSSSPSKPPSLTSSSPYFRPPTPVRPITSLSLIIKEKEQEFEEEGDRRDRFEDEDDSSQEEEEEGQGSPERSVDVTMVLASPVATSLIRPPPASPSPNRSTTQNQDIMMGSPSPLKRSTPPPPSPSLDVEETVQEPTSKESVEAEGETEVEEEEVEQDVFVEQKKTSLAPIITGRHKSHLPTLGPLFTFPRAALPPPPPTIRTTRDPSPPVASTSFLRPSPSPIPSSRRPSPVPSSRRPSPIPSSRRPSPIPSSRPSPSPFRPTHPTLPVVEISSTDPKAAARAAAILKVYHEYVEQGLSVPLRQDVDEEEGVDGLRGVWENAVDEVSFFVGGSKGVGEESESETVDVGNWSKLDWRRLDKVFVEVSRKAKRDGKEVFGGEEVVERFLEREGLVEEDCEGAWTLEKLLVRVEALRERRIRDARRKSTRGDSPACLSHLSSLEEELNRSVGSVVSFSTIGGRVDEEDEAEGEEEEDSGSERDKMEDTFFEQVRSNKIVAPVQPEEVTTIKPPLALASSRFAHLYDDPISKPPLPAQSWGLSTADNDDDGENDVSGDRFSRCSTPGRLESEIGQAPSSARKLLGSIGSFIRPRSRSRSVSPPLPPQREMVQVRPITSTPIVLPAFASTSQPFPSQSILKPHPERRISPIPSTSRIPIPSSTRQRPPTTAGEGKVWDTVNALEDAESSREEDARVLESLQSTGVKRKASETDLRSKSKSKLGGGLSRFGIVWGSLGSPAMIPGGTRALDRPIGSKPSRK